MYDLARADLVQLELLKGNFKSIKKGEAPEFDDRTGMVKAIRMADHVTWAAASPADRPC
jgi:hypothetical protein